MASFELVSFVRLTVRIHCGLLKHEQLLLQGEFLLMLFSMFFD